MKLFEISGFLASFFKLGRYIFNGDSLIGHKHKQMIYKITDFIDGIDFFAVLCGYYNFGTFFAAFFQDFVNPLVKKIAGIRALLRIVSALDDYII